MEVGIEIWRKRTDVGKKRTEKKWVEEMRRGGKEGWIEGGMKTRQTY